MAGALARADGSVPSKPGFKTRKAAEKYGQAQEAAADNGTYVDPRAGRITLIEWVNEWYPAQDLEPTTLVNYRYAIEVHILPRLAPGHWLTSRPRKLASGNVESWRKVFRGVPRKTRARHLPQSSTTQYRVMSG